MCLRRPAKKIRVKSQENANFVRLNLRTTKFKAAVRPRVRVHKAPPQATARTTVILHREPKVLTAANGCLASPHLHRRPARLSGRRSVDRVIGAACGATVGGLAPAMLPRSAKPSVALRLLLLWCYDAAHLWLTCVVLHVPYPINTHTHTYIRLEAMLLSSAWMLQSNTRTSRRRPAIRWRPSWLLGRWMVLYRSSSRPALGTSCPAFCEK